MSLMVPIKKNKKAQITEKKMFDIIQRSFDTEHKCLYEVFIGNGRPDFILIGPRSGIIIFEVKDLPLEAFLGFEKKLLKIKDANGKRKSYKNPWDQLQEYRTQIYNRVFAYNKKNKGSISKKVKPMSVIVFGKITREEFKNHKFSDGSSISDIIKEKYVIFKDDIEDIENNKFTLEEILKSKLGFNSINQRNYDIQWAKSVEKALIKTITVDLDLALDDDIVELDYEQSKLASTLPNTNLLIRGSAGSGKTIILENRAIILSNEAKSTDEKVLFTYYNKAIGNKIRSHLKKLKKPDNLEVTHVDDINTKSKYRKYKYILIDEAQDIELDKIKDLLESCLSEGGSITMCSDGAQNIYSVAYNYKDLEVDFVIYEIDRAYRTTWEIQKLATDLVLEPESQADISDDNLDITYVCQDQAYLREGSPVKFISAENLNDSVLRMENTIEEWHSNGIGFNEIVVITLFNDNIKKIKKLSSKINFIKINENYDLSKSKDEIAISTVNSVKGYEYRNVILIGFDKEPIIPADQYPTKVYVALTRATHNAVIITSDRSHQILNIAKELNENIKHLEVKISQNKEIFHLECENNILRKKLINSKVNELEYENIELKEKLIEKEEEVNSLSNLIENQVKINEKVVYKKSKGSKVINIILVIICLGLLLNQNQSYLLDYRADSNNEITESGDLELSSSKEEIILFDSELTSMNRVDLLLDGEPIRSKKTGDIIDGDYRSDSRIYITEKKDKYYLNLNLIKSNFDNLNEIILIDEGRFALAFSNPSVIVKHKLDEDFIPIDDSFDRVYNKYFTFLYTDTGELVHRRVD